MSEVYKRWEKDRGKRKDCFRFPLNGFYNIKVLSSSNSSKYLSPVLMALLLNELQKMSYLYLMFPPFVEKELCVLLI